MKESLSQFYDKIYSSEKVVFSGGKPEEGVVKISKFIPKGKILDIGGGEGRNALYLAENGYEVEVIDLSQIGLEKLQKLAEEKGLKIKTHTGDITEGNIDGSKDGMISSFMLHHLLKNDALKLIQNMKEHTNEGGINFIAAFTENGDFFKANPLTNRFYPKHDELKTIYEDWDIKDYKEENTEAHTKNPDGTNMKNVSAFLIAQKRKKT